MSQDNQAHRARGRKLKTREQVRLLLAQTLRRVELAGDLGDLDRAKVVVRGAESLHRMLSEGETDVRLLRIEETLKALIDPSPSSSVTPAFSSQLMPSRDSKVN